MTNFELDPVDSYDTVQEPTVLGQLRSVISKKVERQPIFIEVPERPGVTVKVRPQITQHQLKAWRKNSGEDTKAGIDSVKFACSVIGHTTLGIYINDEQAVNANGVALTFASPEILEMTGTTRPLPDCVQAFFGLDPHLEAAALAIMEHAGYGDTVDTVDPTKTS
jgi:hypothetical protein